MFLTSKVSLSASLTGFLKSHHKLLQVCCRNQHYTQCLEELSKMKAKASSKASSSFLGKGFKSQITKKRVNSLPLWLYVELFRKTAGLADRLTTLVKNIYVSKWSKMPKEKVYSKNEQQLLTKYTKQTLSSE